MFRKMRRSRQELTREQCEEILERCTCGTLALSGDGGYPYAVPLSFVYHDGKLWFHGAKTGHKIDAMRKNEKASFCVIDRDEIVPQEYTTYFRSVIVFGKMRILEDDGEKRTACSLLAGKYRPGFEEERNAAIEKEFPALCMFCLEAEHMTGKEAIELVRRREDGTK